MPVISITATRKILTFAITWDSTASAFSISWSRILPNGTGKINEKGVAYYNKVIDYCLEKKLHPVVTLYHWDLPETLEQQGGWTSYRMKDWFSYYAKVCAQCFGDRIKTWIVLNEPMGFTSLGYMLGMHAPGKKGIHHFFPAIHNVLMCQAEGGRIIRTYVPGAYIGTTFSCSQIVPYTQTLEDQQAAQRVNVLMNRLFIEPALGMGYPQLSGFKFLEKMEIFNLAWRHKEAMQFSFDFIGLQNYFPLTIRHNNLIPYIAASEVKPKERNVPYTAMEWEINSKAFGHIIRQFAAYKNCPDILVTENGAAFRDTITNGRINDQKRMAYFEKHLQELLVLKGQHIPVKGYFAWTLTDNFEWNYGYFPKFGLVHVDPLTQQRLVKHSGYWFKAFLNS